jgi:DNA-binding NtrC family response regulator
VENKARILVVDDETGLCDFISHYLQNRGFEVKVAFRAKEALEILSLESFDIILADIMMPTMDGLEMLRLVRTSDPDAVVVMMTAYASLDKAIKAIKYGATDLLVKPFELSTMLKVINKSLEGRGHSSEPPQTQAMS